MQDVYPAEPVAIVASGQRVTVTGRLLVDEATVVLNYGLGHAITHSVRVKLSKISHKIESPARVIARYWAQQKVNDLELFGDDTKEEVLQIARKYSFVTQSASLLVLESLEDVNSILSFPCHLATPLIVKTLFLSAHST